MPDPPPPQKKRTVVGWMMVGILAADIAGEATRIGLCAGVEVPESVPMCRDSSASTAVLFAKVHLLLEQLEIIEHQPPVTYPAPPPDGTNLQQLRRPPGI